MADFSVPGLTQVLGQLLPEPHAGLLTGLLFGTKSMLSRDFYQALIATGTLHIIALSGMNISIIMDMIAGSLQWRFGRRGASLISIIGIVWFVWFVGASATIIRAAIMGSISLISVIFGRQYWALLSWMLAVGIMLLLNLSWIVDISFQLSALATLGIVLFGRVERRSVEVTSKVFDRASASVLSTRSLWSLAKDNLHLTFAAQVFTIPLILFHFHRISFISPLANLAIGWVVAPLTILGWATAVVGWIFLPIGQVFGWISWVLLEYVIRVIYITSTIPMASFGW